MTPEELEQLRRDVDGFRGRFAFVPAHEIDRGTAYASEWVDFEDRLVFIPEGADPDNDDEHHVIGEVEQHIAEPLARMLNAVCELLPK